MEPTSLLFVCLGNICRSPMAEAVCAHMVAERGLTGSVVVASAGTGDWHIGSAPHPSTRAELSRNGIEVPDGSVARQVTRDDLESYDLILAMDEQNLADLRDLAQRAGSESDHISLLLEHAPSTEVRSIRSVPDPYYVGGYDEVFRLVSSGCTGVLDNL